MNQLCSNRRVLQSYIRIWVIIGFAILLPTMLRAQEEKRTLTLAEYRVELQRAEEQLQNGLEEKRLPMLQSELAQIRAVIDADGRQIDIAPLLGEAIEQIPDAAQAQARITMLLAQLEPQNGHDTDAQLTALATIFDQAVFAQQESLWQRLWRWLRRWLPNLSRAENEAPNGIASLLLYGLGYIIIAVAAILLIWLLSIWLQNLAGVLLGNVNRQRRLTPDGELLNAAEAKAQAEELARGGSFREAVRRLYLAALLTLDEHDQLHYDRSNTNREVLATVRNNHRLHERLQPVVETFDSVWYGVHEPDQSTFDQYKRSIEELEQQNP